MEGLVDSGGKTTLGNHDQKGEWEGGPAHGFSGWHFQEEEETDDNTTHIHP